MTLRGSEFLQQILTLSPGPNREQAVLDALPHATPWPLIDVPVVAGDRAGVLRVAADVFSIGTADDFVRVPVDARTAQRIADAQGLALPTSRIVDAIWQAADVKLDPIRFDPATHDIRAVSLWAEHNRRIELARDARWGLVAGHKKAIVRAAGLGANFTRVFIYGWHLPTGKPIQKLQRDTLHEWSYWDYSHGLFLVEPLLRMNDGAVIELDQALLNPELAPMVSDEVPFPAISLRYPISHRSGLSAPASQAAPATRRFMQARHYQPVTTPPRAIQLIVLHTMESAEVPKMALAVAQWFASAASPVASAHFCVDDREIVGGVRPEDVAYGAPGANHNGLQIELAGIAGQGCAGWGDAYSTRVLAQASVLCAELCARYNLPVQFVDAAGLLRGERGITTHAEVSRAFRKSDHWDPGPSFPWAGFMARIEDLL